MEAGAALIKAPVWGDSGLMDSGPRYDDGMASMMMMMMMMMASSSPQVPTAYSIKALKLKRTGTGLRVAT